MASLEETPNRAQGDILFRVGAQDADGDLDKMDLMDPRNPNELPDIQVEPGIRKGRVPREGYQRGWGLQFGSLLKMIEQEDLFKRASEPAAEFSSWTSLEKRANLYLILTRFLPKLVDRNVVEFGVFKGGTSLFMAMILRVVAPEATLYALDTFEGMPATDKTIDAHSKGDFNEAAFDLFHQKITRLVVAP